MLLLLIGVVRAQSTHDHDMAGHDMADHEPSLLDRAVVQNASGTSWEPVSTPMYMFAYGDLGRWTAMFHGALFAGVVHQAGPRGGTSFASPNQAMAMAYRPIGGAGQVMLRGMLSAEPFTVGPRGYPLLLQTGETWEGRPLHDRQHPHDLFMEIAAIGRVAPTRGLGFELYVAPVGEPALGPTAFPHRISAMFDPLAPLGHHWMDSTHIAFGVLTAGVFGRSVKLEGSWFNGREPDENRYDFDLDVPDSWSGRLTVALGPDWTVQGSAGWLASPEALRPGVPVWRITGSATWNHPYGDGSNVAATAAWGRNIEAGEFPTDSVLLESTLDPAGPPLLYGRVSREVKSGHDLVVDPDGPFALGSADLGGAWLFAVGERVETGLGIRGNASRLPAALEPFYGTRTATGVFVYAQLRPAPMSMAGPHDH